MAKGFLTGAIWGAVVAVVGAGAVSVVTGPVMTGGVTPEAGSVEVSPGSGFNGERDDQAAEMPGVQPGTEAPALPKVAAPEKDDLAAMERADLEPGAQPEAPGSEAGLAAPEAVGGETPAVSSAEEGAVARGDAAKVVSPEAPELEPSISTEPAQPQPPVSEETAGLATSEPGGPAPEVQSAAPQEPAPMDEDGEQVSGNAEGSAVEEDREEVVIKIAPEAEDASDEMPAPAEPEAVEAAPQPAETTDETPAETPPETPVISLPKQDEPTPPARVETVPEVASGAGLGQPASTMPQSNGAVKTNRLPSVGATPEVAEDSPQPEAEVAVDKSGLPPVERFAMPFEGDENKPKMSIVLIDEGQGPVGVEALTTFPYPLTFAVDTSRPDAEEAMAKYRAAGFEVLAMVRLPEGATPVDVEQALPVMMAKVPEAVGVMEAPGDGIQFDRKVSDQVAQILGDQGYGLLLYSKGLNTAQKLAAKNGVPSATIFRDFDANGQNASAIRRFLNHGAMKAESEDGVVMVGRLRPDTVTALLLWGLEDRARQVTLAPVTKLLKANR